MFLVGFLIFLLFFIYRLSHKKSLGDCVPYLPTHFITDDETLYRNTPIGKKPTQWGTASLIYQPISSLMMKHSTVILPLVKNPRSGGLRPLFTDPFHH